MTLPRRSHEAVVEKVMRSSADVLHWFWVSPQEQTAASPVSRYGTVPRRSDVGLVLNVAAVSFLAQHGQLGSAVAAKASPDHTFHHKLHSEVA